MAPVPSEEQKQLRTKATAKLPNPHTIGGSDVHSVRNQGTGDYEFLALSGI